MKGKRTWHFRLPNGMAACDKRWEGDTQEWGEVTCWRCLRTKAYREVLV